MSSTPPAQPKPKPEKFRPFHRRLRRWFSEDKQRPRRLTLIFGAGLAVALSNRNPSATWGGLLTTLTGTLEKLAGTGGRKDPQGEDWFIKASIVHRMHIIRSLAAGDADMCVATTYLLERFQRLFLGLHSQDWQFEVNRLTVEFEQKVAEVLQAKRSHRTAGPADALAKWAAVLKRAGKLARAGRCLLVTTNFDHLLAQLSELPIFLPTLQHQQDDVLKDGFVIPVEQLQEPAMLDLGTAIHLNEVQQPAPQTFKNYWRAPGAHPQDWHGELASVLHIHGSRLLPGSLVFEPAGYDRVAGSKNNPMERLFREPSNSGAIVTLGCGETLWDPHFSRYWNRGDRKPSILPLDAFVSSLFDGDSVEDRCRQKATLSIPHDQMPLMVNAGPHSELSDRLSDLLDLVESL